MDQKKLTEIIWDQTRRALWELDNVADAVPDDMWELCYCGMPVWKHIYHTLHSLDRWYVNPRDSGYQEPWFHVENLNNLDVVSDGVVPREDLNRYRGDIRKKIESYLLAVADEELLEYPEGCEYSRFTLILAQFRHLHTHMGMLMGFVVARTGLWPRVVGLEKGIPEGEYERYF